MEYTIQKLARLAGVTTRTLRYYDQVGLLKPVRVSSAGYRIYGPAEVDRLQQILFYRELDLPLEEIRRIITRPGFQAGPALAAHRQRLFDRRQQLDQLIETLDKTIAAEKGEKTMSDREKFEGFKRGLVAENERKYGREIRQNYGEATVEASNRKLLNLNEADFARMQAVEAEMFDALRILLASGGSDQEAARTVCAKHREWLSFTWPTYTPEAHRGLAEMYVADERFASYYNDRGGEGAAVALRDAIVRHAGREES